MINTQIYNSILSSVSALFPNKQRIHNPYELSDNPELIMKDSWGIKVGQSSLVELVFCNLSTEREYSLLLIRQFASVGSKDTAFDAVTTSILEDQALLLDVLHSPNELGIPDIINNLVIGNISGIEFMQANEKKYLFCEVAFNITTSTPVV
jgi:hypothetical protein